MSKYGNRVDVILVMSCPNCGATISFSGSEHMSDPEPFDCHTMGDFLFNCEECGKEFRLALQEHVG